MKQYHHKKRKIIYLLLLTLIVVFAFSLFIILTQMRAPTQQTRTESYPQYPKIDYGTGAKADQIRRGEYLVRAGDCITCHTNTEKGKQAFSGDFPMSTPFGTVYGQNITPDKETGIGSWTDEQFIKAMTQGIAPDGSYFTPAFPYVYFNKLSKKDLLDIRAYLNAIPPVKQKAMPLKLHWPFNYRWLQFFWRALFFTFQETGPYKPDPTKSAAWNRGAYLVQGLGHCGMCHTRKNFLGADKTKYYLKGGLVSGYNAPDITAIGLKNMSLNDIVNVFLNNQLVSGTKITGPMSEVNHNSLRYLRLKDLKAIALYLKNVKSNAVSIPNHQTGKNIYNEHCAGCHSNSAVNAPQLQDKAAWVPLIKQGLDVLDRNTIEGIRGMPPKGLCTSCTNQQLQAAVRYMVSVQP